MLIHQALEFPPLENYNYFSEEALVYEFQNFYGGNYAKLSFDLMVVGHVLPLELTVFPLDSFVEYFQPILQVLVRVLGRENTSIIDRAVVGLFH